MNLINTSNSFDESEPNSKKKARRSPRDSDLDADKSEESSALIDPRLFEVKFPKEYEAAFATAVFELGLKHSSPKIIMPLMPVDKSLSTEHIKSHLQKYRIHHQRSKEEFMSYYNNHIREAFKSWEANRGWERQSSLSSSSLHNTHQHTEFTKNDHSSSTGRLHSSHSSSATLHSDHDQSHSGLGSVEAVSKEELLKKADSMIQEWRNLYQDSVGTSAARESLLTTSNNRSFLWMYLDAICFVSNPVIYRHIYTN